MRLPQVMVAAEMEAEATRWAGALVDLHHERDDPMVRLVSPHAPDGTDVLFDVIPLGGPLHADGTVDVSTGRA